jgi:hypothetical protein
MDDLIRSALVNVNRVNDNVLVSWRLFFYWLYRSSEKGRLPTSQLDRQSFSTLCPPTINNAATCLG